ncbi:RNA pseudouridine synthase 4, mitochondrial isoform X6 [Phalaenopsis equestris]|uniref:RNA pseudouridine synthase 4, mitochondrial isoform X6 n=1 Tax=Phalaenopsis equestris TaxID=78828 RepID=UPI0009E51BF8|nr:RNA pseudouridine synthase 4, mitochondrial isoform X6 [Phalaenopsis equestris]
MAALRRLERGCHSSPLFSRAQVEEISGSILHRSSFSSTVLSSLVGGNGEEKRREKGKWLTLPPFVSQKGPSSVGKELAGGKLAGQEEITTALKWVHQCFPHLPMSLVQKLFRLRQVRKELVSSGAQYEGQQLKRVSAKETLSSGEVILLPISVENFTKENNENPYNQKEIKFMRSLILYKDSAIIVINKPHGLPVQGGLGIRNSIDVLAATSLKFDSQESPKLVILEDGKSERITVIKERPASSQHALTEYKVIKTSNGYTWLELCPLTGRKHQLRVHCAEVLKTPIVGDYKYGWHAHKKWELIVEARTSKLPKEKHPFGLDFESGSISEKQPRLHLHCHQLILPNIAEAGRHLEPSSATKLNLAELDMLDLVAPLPPYMVHDKSSYTNSQR